MKENKNSRLALPPLAWATWPQVDQSERKLLIVPLGSLEQHGPHLPLDTDARIASAVASEVHKKCRQVGLAPCITIGASGEHAEFPGTLSIGTKALALMLIELVRHASLFWEQVMVINGHGGNIKALQIAKQRSERESRSLTVHHIEWENGDSHAGASETSLMLHLAPNHVRMDLAEPGNFESIQHLLPKLRAQGVRAVSENGVLGDPRDANTEVGAELFAQISLVATERAQLILNTRLLGNS